MATAAAQPPGLAEAGALARRLFAGLLRATGDAPGVTRVAYGDGETRAFAMMAEAAAAWNAETVFDPAGNQFITLPGDDRSRRIVIGSHLDSVPHGGNFDGAAGVILGIALQCALSASGRKPPFDLTVACLRAEESCWFPHSYIGSKTALGLLAPEVLDQVKSSRDGQSLGSHIAAAGFDPEAVGRHRTWLVPDEIVAFIEPHIEQAPLLLSQGLPVGVVTGIRGSFRYREARCIGEYSHSGAMPHDLRRDAVLATARLVCAMEDYWVRMAQEGHDLTVTFGQLATDPAQDSFSKVSGETRFCLDVRSQDEAMLERAEQHLFRAVADIGAATGTTFELGPRSGSEPARMDDRLAALLEASAQTRGVATRRMGSGAGHDAATFAQAGIPTAMLFIRNEHGSHNPDEHMEFADFEAALSVLDAALSRPRESWETR